MPVTTRRAFLAGATIVSILPLALRNAIFGGHGRRHKGSGGRRHDPRGQGQGSICRHWSRTAIQCRSPWSVESPMTPTDHVKAIHVFNEKNRSRMSSAPASGRRTARTVIATRIKLADSQKIIAIAETSSGESGAPPADVIVTLAACIEDVT